MVAGVTTPYSTVAPMFGPAPAWVPPAEQERYLSYGVYENIYWNRPETFKVVVRGAEDKPIYVPTGRTIVDTTNRYVATGFSFTVHPAFGTDAEKALAQQTFEDFFDREKFASKFVSNKRFGLIRGDWLWHLFADPDKPEGRRLSIQAVDPGSYFPVYAPNDPDKLIRVHLVDQYLNEKGEERLKRLTYDKDPETGAITVSEGVFKLDNWYDTPKPEVVIQPPTLLPPEITTIPVYHVKNFEEPGNPFGSSELRGLERIMSAVNQAISDEDIALALEGLGVYATDGGGPVDEDGNDTDWVLGPGEVVENAINFRRVNGVNTLGPYGEHIERLVQFMEEASATPKVAIGKVDVQVAESGVALHLQMGPMLSKADEKDLEVVGVHKQMFFDLRTWFRLYENINLDNVRIIPTLGDKLPVNKSKEIDLILTLVRDGIMSRETARPLLAKYGYVFAANEQELVDNEARATAAAFAGPGTPGAQDDLTTENRIGTEL